MKNQIAIAEITANDEPDAEIIQFLVDENFKVTASNGEEVSYGDSPKTAAEAFEIVHSQWGQWDSFDWLAEYDGNVITPMEENE